MKYVCVCACGMELISLLTGTHAHKPLLSPCPSFPIHLRDNAHVHFIHIEKGVCVWEWGGGDIISCQHFLFAITHTYGLSAKARGRCGEAALKCSTETERH